MKKKLQDILKGQTTQFKREQASEQNSDMAGMLESSDQEFTITTINTLSTAMDEEHVRTDGQC